MFKFVKVMIGIALVLGLVSLFGCDDGGSSSGDGDSDYMWGGVDDGDTSYNPDFEFAVIPTSPKNVTAVASGTYSIKVSWDEVTNADSYVVYYRTFSGINDNMKMSGTELKKTTQNTSLLLTSLESKVYLFWVTAKNSAGESFSSIDCDAYEAPNVSSSGSSTGSGSSSSTTTLSAPTKLTATASSSSSISLSWNSVNGATRYSIYKSEYPYSSSASLYSNTTSTSATVTGLKASTTYYFWVKANNGTTVSDFSVLDLATTLASSSTTPSQSYGSIKVVNNSSYPVKNVQMYTTYSASLSGVLLGLDTVIPAGSFATFSNVTPGTYVRIGSETYRSRKISTNTTVVIKSGLTSTLTITDSDIISN